MQRYITVIVSEHDYEESEDSYDSPNCTHNQTSYSMENILKEEWFRSYLKDLGFYCKDEADTSGLTHLDNFIYEYGSGGYKYYTDKISDLKSYNCDKLRVYQEVIGAERLHGVGKIIKSREAYLRKQAESAKKQQDKYEAAKAAKKLKQIEKAKALLSQEGLLND